MMRAPKPTFPTKTSARSRVLMRALLASGAALAVVQPLSAQSSRGGFSLPQPSPTPTPAPQGPVDERAGVPIGPRVIRETPAPTPTPAPTRAAPAPTPTPTPAPAPAPTPASARTSAPTPAPSASRPAATRPATRTPTPSAAPSSTPSPSRAPAPGAGAAIPLDGAAPGFETLPGPDEPLPEVGPDGWYDVTPQGEAGSAPAGNAAPTTSASDFAAIREAARRNQLLIGISLLILIGTTLATLIWRRKRRESEQLTGDGTMLARGVSRTIAGQMAAPLGDLHDDDAEDGAKDGEAKEEAAPVSTPRPSPTPAPAPPEPAAQPKPAKPEPAPAPAPTPSATRTDLPEPDFGVAAVRRPPVRLDLAIEIGNASRSMMMFTVDFRIDIANRSDHAARDLAVSAKLACAQSGVSGNVPLAGAVSIGRVERIGPHQSHRLSGQLQLPLSEVTAIRQGATPIFIPMLHVTIEGAGQPDRLSSFVIGTPSAAANGRVHPIPLDGPPGGIPGLRAQLVNDTKGADAT